MARRRWCVVALSACVLFGGLACSSSPPEPTTADLVKGLSILKTQQQFTDAQVRCVAERAEARLHGPALRRFAKGLETLGSDGSTSGMDAVSLKTFTDAIAACAAGAG